jgi:hypothetical protein
MKVKVLFKECETFNILETKNNLVGIGFVFHRNITFIGDRIDFSFADSVNNCATLCAMRAGNS